jgi:hypothetical protein
MTRSVAMMASVRDKFPLPIFGVYLKQIQTLLIKK